MDYNQMPFGFEFAFAGDRMIDGYSNMSDDEKREYIERNRNRLSEHELDKLTASLGKEEEEVPHFDNPSSLFRDRESGRFIFFKIMSSVKMDTYSFHPNSD